MSSDVSLGYIPMLHQQHIGLVQTHSFRATHLLWAECRHSTTVVVLNTNAENYRSQYMHNVSYLTLQYDISLTKLCLYI